MSEQCQAPGARPCECCHDRDAAMSDVLLPVLATIPLGLYVRFEREPHQGMMLFTATVMEQCLYITGWPNHHHEASKFDDRALWSVNSSDQDVLLRLFLGAIAERGWLR